MRIIGRAADMAEAARAFRAAGEGVALVPTMGALHDGHLSLVALASRGGRRVVVSVFVNPTQFGPGEDFERYPRDPARDAALLEKAGADVLFMPDAGEVYPPGFASWVQLPSMENVLCGRYRPGHFRGVATVCCILFGMVGPDGGLEADQAVEEAARNRRRRTARDAEPDPLGGGDLLEALEPTEGVAMVWPLEMEPGRGAGP